PVRGRLPPLPEEVPRPWMVVPLPVPCVVTVLDSMSIVTTCVWAPPFGSTPESTIVCSPVGVSAGMTTVVFTLPSLSGFVLPRSTGLECNVRSTSEPPFQPVSVTVTEPPGATTSELTCGPGTVVVVVEEPSVVIVVVDVVSVVVGGVQSGGTHIVEVDVE